MRAPLAERMRPRTLAEFVGQEHLLGGEGPLSRSLRSGSLRSTVFWGDPGVGKTTLARLVAAKSELRLVQISAVLSGLPELKAALQSFARPQGLFAEAEEEASGPVGALFVDEIHRWNKAQQDALLPDVESGRILLLGATTESPHRQIIPALRSRVDLMRLRPLREADLVKLLTRALQDEERGLGGSGLALEPAGLQMLAEWAEGDARRALGWLDQLQPGDSALQQGEVLAQLRSAELPQTRRSDIVSAWIKSMRGSDPDAAIYWLARLLHQGEDPLFLTRRLMIFASEDVGNADPQGIQLAASVALAVERVGMPEGRIPLAHATTYLACAPKSSAAYRAIGLALEEVQRSGELPVPESLRNPPPPWAEPYRSPHQSPWGILRQEHSPVSASFYTPSPWGYEKTIQERLNWWERKLREQGD